MTSTIYFLILIPILSILLLSLNFVLAAHRPYKEKKTPFECGYHSFLKQTRVQFSVSFYTFGLLFLILDLEVLGVYPLTTALANNSTFGLYGALIFIIIVTIGFIFEYGKGALTIQSKQK